AGHAEGVQVYFTRESHPEGGARSRFLAGSAFPISVYCACLEKILQRELHDSRIARRNHLTEGCARKVRRRIVHSEAVREVERLGSELHLLRFPEAESSRKCHVELPGARTFNGAAADITEGAGRCLGIWLGVE